MSDLRGFRLAWAFVALSVVAAGVSFYGVSPAGASEDHDEAHELRSQGEVRPLAEILGRADLSGLKVLEADLEHKRGGMVYELELLDSAGRVQKRYFDAATGQPLGRAEDD